MFTLALSPPPPLLPLLLPPSQHLRGDAGGMKLTSTGNRYVSSQPLEGKKQDPPRASATADTTTPKEMPCGGCGESMLSIARFCTGCGFQNAATAGKGEFSVMEQLQILNLQVCRSGKYAFTSFAQPQLAPL